MKFSTRIIAGIGASLILFAACKKDKDDDKTNVTPTENKKDNLLNGKWQYEAFSTVTHVKDSTMGIDTTFNSDLGDLEACDKDDFIIFLSSGKVSVDEGATKCDPSDPQVDSTSTWSLNSDNTKITVTEQGSTSPSTYDIQELSSSKMKIHLVEEEKQGTMKYTTDITITYKNIK